MDTNIGLFEIHITVSCEDIFKLRMYCLDQKIKSIMAVSGYGEHPIQPMISKYKNGTAEEVIDKAKNMAMLMKNDYYMTVTRVKVESMMHNRGVPIERNEIWTAKEYYFEFHLKITVSSRSEWTELADSARSKGARLSFNTFKHETFLLVTLRLPGVFGSIEAEKKKDELMKYLKTRVFHSNDGIQQEFSVYDTNVHLDDGWLE